MKPDRYEWLHAEQERRARDPYGLVAIKDRAVRTFQRRMGVVLAIVPPGLLMAFLTEGRGRTHERTGLIILGIFELVAALIIWRWVQSKTLMIKAMGWAALLFGLFVLALGIDR